MIIIIVKITCSGRTPRFPQFYRVPFSTEDDAVKGRRVLARGY